MLNKKEKARLDDIEEQVRRALNLIKTQKMRNDDLILENIALREQILELRNRLKVQNADV
jgi:hypothetical protein